MSNKKAGLLAIGTIVPIGPGGIPAVKLIAMNLQLSEEEQAFQSEVRSFLAEHWATREYLMPGPRLSLARHRFVQALASRGWLAGQWPVALGGAGWSDRVRLLWEQEAASVCAPQTPYQGTDILGPWLMGAGTASQQARHLPGIASGEVFWCQAFTEDTGALDLAQIESRATRATDVPGWRLTGKKPWVLDIPHRAEDAQCWFYLLALTQGVAGAADAQYSVFLLDAGAPGLSMRSRPMIGELPGQHAVHEVIFEDVYLADDALLGDLGSGAKWAALLEQAELTRPGMVARNAVLLNELRAYVDPIPSVDIDSTTIRVESQESSGAQRALAPDGALLWADSDFRARLHGLEVELSALQALEARAWSEAESVGDAAEESLQQRQVDLGQQALRLGLAQRIGPLNQKLADLQVDALGYFALPLVDFSALDNEGPIGPEFAQPALLGMLLSSARAAIGAPREHLKNIIAKSVLTLPESAPRGNRPSS